MDIEKIKSLFTEIIPKFYSIEKKVVDFGDGNMLFPSELHFLRYLSKNQGCRIGEIANHFSFTRGASSQLVNKLEKRKIVEKYQQAEDKKAVFVKLSKKGKAYVKHHNAFHERLNAEIFDWLKDLANNEELELLEKLFLKMKKSLDQFL